MNPTFILRLTRHGKTEKHDIDPLRELDQVGQNQALRVASAMENDQINLALVSPTARTHHMADIVLKGHQETSVMEFPEIYSDPRLPENAEIWKMFRAVGNKPIADYLTHPDFHLLEAVGIASADRIQEILQEVEDDIPLIWLAGHAVLNQSVARAVAFCYDDKTAISAIEKVEMQEGETLELIVFEDDNRVDVKLIPLVATEAVAR